jgi:hypothetical protein
MILELGSNDEKQSSGTRHTHGLSSQDCHSNAETTALLNARATPVKASERRNTTHPAD